MPSKSKQSFEKSLKELEKIVSALESGDLPLERALEKFEAGIRLSRLCSKTLDEAEKKVTLLMANDEGTFEERSLDTDSE